MRFKASYKSHAFSQDAKKGICLGARQILRSLAAFFAIFASMLSLGQGASEPSSSSACPGGTPWSEVAVRDLIAEASEVDFQPWRDFHDSVDPEKRFQVLTNPDDSLECAALNERFSSLGLDESKPTTFRRWRCPDEIVYYRIGDYLATIMFERPGPGCGSTGADFRRNPHYTVELRDEELKVLTVLSKTGR